jgi:decaprenylphospho-beta-D-erythro-pentofuranosid-2-ulose 2-reductase
MGSASVGFLGFSIPGWSLAIDIPKNTPDLRDFLDYLERLALPSDAKIVRLGISDSADFFLDLNSKFDESIVKKSFDGTDIDLFILASGMLGGLASDSNSLQIIEQCNVNFTNSIATLKTVSEMMLAQGHGSIVIFSSVASLRPRQENYIYGASKAALDFYARGLADYLDNSGVHICIVRPGFVLTKMTKDLERRPFSLSPEDVALIVEKGLRRRKLVVYAPSFLRYLFFILSLLPRRLFLKLK